jgi:hypothetical protein
MLFTRPGRYKEKKCGLSAGNRHGFEIVGSQMIRQEPTFLCLQ